MKKITFMLLGVVLSAVVMAFAEGEQGGDLRPIQKVMRARAGWLKAMNENLSKENYQEIARDAESLSEQTKKISENLQGERQEITLKVSKLAQEAAYAASRKEIKILKLKLGDIKTTCGSCHSKYRDKK